MNRHADVRSDLQVTPAAAKFHGRRPYTLRTSAASTKRYFLSLLPIDAYEIERDTRQGGF